MRHKILPILLGIGVFVFDQILKAAALTHPQAHWYFIKPWLGWEYFPNPGIAFSVPIPNAAVIALTPVILFLIGWWWVRQSGKKNWTAASLVLAGALSNFLDRLRLEITVDYLRILYSVINLADIAIVLGIIWIVFSRQRSNSPAA